MSKIAIVTDSTSGLTDKDLEQMGNVFMIHFDVQIDGKSYREGIDISDQQFYHELATSNEFPTTAPPSMQEMFDFYDKVAAKGFDEIISIHITSGITGFYNNLVAALPEYQGPKVHAVDSFLSIQPMGYLVRYASKMAQDGVAVDEILSKVDSQKRTIGEYFIVDDLKNLVHGGRLTNAAAFTGSLLKIKPVLTMMNDKHEIVAIEKIRTMKRALHYIESEFDKVRAEKDYKLRLFLTGTNNLEDIEKWRERLALKYPDLTIDVGQIGPVIGTHIGANTFVLGWSEEVFDK